MPRLPPFHTATTDVAGANALRITSGTSSTPASNDTWHTFNAAEPVGAHKGQFLAEQGQLGPNIGW